MPFVLVERDTNGRLRKFVLDGPSSKSNLKTRSSGVEGAQRSKPHSAVQPGLRQSAVEFLTKVFLPTGYPSSVTPDYLRFQILNALQAFCSSLAGLLSSRAVLEGFGVGDANATATGAVLLTIVQDVFSRLTTIIGAYYFGSSLYPEAKNYRLLADILNDCAIVIDALLPLLPRSTRTIFLCLSASCRSLCGLVVGGAKAAITLHFSSPASGTGDVGDLNAKDSSKETVLALCGMLLGSVVVPSLTTPLRTYLTLFLLVFLHLLINYFGVKGLQLRTLNRQRAALLWYNYRNKPTQSNEFSLLPASISKQERILDRSGVIRDDKGQIMGEVTIGSSFVDVLNESGLGGGGANVDRVSRTVEVFKDERYIVWLDATSPHSHTGNPGSGPHDPLRIHVCLKTGYTHRDLLKGWCHAIECCLLARQAANRTGSGRAQTLGEYELTQRAYAAVCGSFDQFVEKVKGVWDLGSSGLVSDGTLLLSGLPRGVLDPAHTD